MAELPKWIKAVPANVTIAADDLSSQLVRRYQQLTESRATPGMRAEDSAWTIEWPRAELEIRVFAGGAAEEAGDDPLDYRPQLEALLHKHSRNGIATWGVGVEKAGVFLGTYDEGLRWWIKGELIFSPSTLLARDFDLVLIADEQRRFTVVGAPLWFMEELDVALGGKMAICEAFDAYIANFGIGFGEEDRKWAETYLRTPST